MAKDEIHRIEVIRLKDIFHLIFEFISILIISLSDHLSLPKIERLPKIRVIQDSFLLGFLQTFDMGIHCLRKLLPVTF